MVGLGETYFSAFVLALNGGEIASGLITALPLLVGATMQLAAPWAVRRIGSHKRWVVFCSGMQSASLLLLPIAAWLGAPAVKLVYVTAVLYWGMGLAAGPAWNTWIEGIVPRRVRTRFFAYRVRISQACILLGFIVGGVTLQYGKDHGHTLLAFSAIFLVAAVCRAISTSFLGVQSVPRHVVKEQHVSMRTLFGGERSSASTRLLFYLFAVQASAFIAGPYFVPFMFSHLEVTYWQYAMLIGTSFIGKVLTLPLWGRVAHYAGTQRLLWIGGLSIIPVSGAWMVSQNLWYLAALQFVAGVTWAAYELAFFLMFFETIPREQRTSVLTIYNFGYSLSQVLGACVGAIFLNRFGKTYDAYLWLFVVSSFARCVTVVLLARIPVIRMPKDIGHPAIRTMAVSSGDEGTLDQLILTSLPEAPADEIARPTPATPEVLKEQPVEGEINLDSRAESS